MATRKRQPVRTPTPAAAVRDVEEELAEMKASVDLKQRLLAPRFAEANVELAVGTVRVRALSNGEVFAINKVARKIRGENGELEVDTEDLYTHCIARGLVEPTMTVDEVRTWQRNAPAGEIEATMAKIQKLSGLAPSAEKEAYKSIRDGSDSGVRIPAGDETVHDGGAAARPDEQ